MDLLFWGLTIGTIGKVFLGLAVILVHEKIISEHRIDWKVLGVMERERFVVGLGLLLMLIGYVLELSYYGYTPWIDSIVSTFMMK